MLYSGKISRYIDKARCLVNFFLLLISFYSQSQQQYMQLSEIVTDSIGIFTTNELTELREKLTDSKNKNYQSISGSDDRAIRL